MSMTETEARTFRAAYEGAVKRYSRMAKAALITAERELMAAQGAQHVYGGPSSRDELIRSILDLRGYTIAKLNETTHILYHQETNGWTACEWCHPHSDASEILVDGVRTRCECPLRDAS